MDVRPIQAWEREATTRFLTDPDFHARVLMAAALTRATAEANGVRLSSAENAGLIQAAVYGLLMQDYNPTDLFSADEVVKSMRSTAEKMGMTLGVTPSTEISFEAQAVPEAFGG